MYVLKYEDYLRTARRLHEIFSKKLESKNMSYSQKTAYKKSNLNF